MQLLVVLEAFLAIVVQGLIMTIVVFAPSLQVSLYWFN